MKMLPQMWKTKILLIDDDHWIRDSLCMFFESEECHIRACQTAEEGLEALKHATYDVMIVDYHLPGMDGLEFFSRIREHSTEVIKVIITAYKTDTAISRAQEFGIHALIEKPFRADTIVTLLRRLQQNKQKESELICI